MVVLPRLKAHVRPFFYGYVGTVSPIFLSLYFRYSKSSSILSCYNNFPSRSRLVLKIFLLDLCPNFCVLWVFEETNFQRSGKKTWPARSCSRQRSWSMVSQRAGGAGWCCNCTGDCPRSIIIFVFELLWL